MRDNGESDGTGGPDQADDAFVDGCVGSTVRRAWTHLVACALPAAAQGHGWPVSTREGFERVLLDHAVGAPWETRVRRPCADFACLFDLMIAVETGARVLDGAACVSELNRRSLALRAPRGDCAPPRAVDDAPGVDRAVATLMRRAIAAQARPRRG